MKTLVLHPDDRSTDFLKPIYADIKSKTVIVKDVTAGRLREAIHTHDVIIMLGHGCANGLFNVAAVGKGPYTVGHELVEELRGKQLIAIWCNVISLSNVTAYKQCTVECSSAKCRRHYTVV
jgi:hypothetical protein